MREADGRLSHPQDYLIRSKIARLLPARARLKEMAEVPVTQTLQVAVSEEVKIGAIGTAIGARIETHTVETGDESAREIARETETVVTGPEIGAIQARRTLCSDVVTTTGRLRETTIGDPHCREGGPLVKTTAITITGMSL